jgi:glycine/D-amino acid oxidase-like deaminating enzyme
MGRAIDRRRIAGVGEPRRESEVAVVGAGIVGLAVARELLRRHPDLSLVVLEREAEIASGQTGETAGLSTPGYYSPLPERGRVEGAWNYAFCEERRIEPDGKLISTEEELPRLDESSAVAALPGRGRRRSAPMNRRIEPHARGLPG